MLSGQFEAFKALIPTLSTPEQVTKAMGFVLQLDDYAKGQLWPLCEEAMKRVTTTPVSTG